MEGFGDTAMKVGLFFLVQALVYLILTKSSNLFSNSTASNMRSVSFKTVRSVSIRRIMAALADLPAGGEPSPSVERTLPPPETSLKDRRD
ncbi:hypothetical protein QJS04_geneDACA017488 [Acorus gramineus]|uniref:Uncharacterized protein n=1 Tax=Acorus gramineus TaxID=55184 RepID=A0AAV9AFN0_ACOGR|nr:hypothetical protein QJS04_geneDACA017488 [Acorus gramineus]